MQPSQTHDFRRLFPLPLAVIASQASMASVPPLFVEIGREFDVSVGIVGQVRSVSAAFAVATALLVGGWIHRHGARPVMIAGGLLGALGALICAAAPSFLLLFVGQAVVGMGICCLLASGFAGAGEFFAPEARGWAIGWVTGLQALAWIVGIPIVGYLAHEFSWRAGFAVPVTICLAATVIAALVAPKIDRELRAVDERTGLFAALSDRYARRWTVGELVAFAVWTGEITYIAAFYIERYDLTEAVVGLLLPVGSISFLIGSTLSEQISERFSRRMVLVWSSLAMGSIAVLMFSYSPVVSVTVAIAFCIGIAAGLRAAASSTLALNQLPDDPGAMMAARTAAVQIGYLVGASIGGIAVEMAGYESLGVIMIFGMALSALVMAGVPERGPGEP